MLAGVWDAELEHAGLFVLGKLNMHLNINTTVAWRSFCYAFGL